MIKNAFYLTLKAQSLWRHSMVNKRWIPSPGVSCSKPLGGLIDQVPGISGNLVVKSKAVMCLGSLEVIKPHLQKGAEKFFF